MNTFFNVEMLPAIQGDSLWLEYGQGDETNRMLIDGGPINAFPAIEKKIETLPEGDKAIELIVITHVDTDHIEGIIRLFAEDRSRWKFRPMEIWFNGYKHMEKAAGILGGKEGDFLSALIERRSPDEWNTKFKGGPVEVDLTKNLPELLFDSGMKITVLSPNADKLKEMAKKWEMNVKESGFEPGDLEKAWEMLIENSRYHVSKGVLGGDSEFEKKLEKQLKTDPSAANGSSIAFLAEFGGKKCLFLGDAHHQVICNSIQKMGYNTTNKLRVDAVKISHHGSRNNISKSLMRLIDAEKYLFSTNGFKFKHPNKSAVEAVIKWSEREPVLYFNYETKFNSSWKKGAKVGGKSYDARYPKGSASGILVEL